MPFYSLQNCPRLAVFNNVRMRLWDQGIVNLVLFGLWMDSIFVKKIVTEWGLKIGTEISSSFKLSVYHQNLLVKAPNFFSCKFSAVSFKV